MLGRSKNGFQSVPGGNRSLDNWQDETNADKFGNTSPEAEAYANTGFEDIIFDEKHNFGDTFYRTAFLDIDDEQMRLQGGESNWQLSFDLDEMVKSTGTKR